MIWTVLQIQFRRLIHNRTELLLTFVVPVAFFSIFALIFVGGVGNGSTPKIKVAAVDEIQSDSSRQVMQSLRESAGLRFIRDNNQDAVPTLDRESAAQLVRQGTLTMAIVLRESESSESVDAGSAEQIRGDLLADSSDQVASQVVTALVARAIMLAQAKEQEQHFNVFGNGSVIPASAIESSTESSVIHATVPENEIDQINLDPAEQSRGPVEVIDVIGKGKSNPVVSMYAAGIAVMFLLFGATAGGGALLEERENQTLDRVLSTHLSMDQLLLGKWFFMTCIGIVQVTVMFIWAQVVFQVDLIGHLDGFLMMTIVTASAASAFGLFLATLCKTRGQLNGLSVILILTMSALGGSMVPRYVMSQPMQEFGLWTFNAWALDGYNKVFWRDLPPASLAPQLIVLMACGMAFLVAARVLAIRWETN